VEHAVSSASFSGHERFLGARAVRGVRAPQGESAVLAHAAMLRYAAGDDAAFAELYRLLAPRLRRLCVYLCGPSDADELVQEVFLRIHRARESFTDEGSVVAWSFTIARLTHLDRVRYRARRPVTHVEHHQLDNHAEPLAEDPERLACRHALLDRIDGRLALLSENVRAAYVLVRLEGASCADAGAALGISVHAVKQRVHRASEALKECLAPDMN
jgi:RNA polymerase sigma-70 factor, ECF subfamily